MRKFLLAAVSAAAIASPAVARDGSGYVGVEAGAMLAEDTKLDFDDGVTRINNAVAVDYDTGFDVGLIGGYDFGMVRAEGELSYKRASVNEVVFGDLGGAVCDDPSDCIVDADGRGSVLSAMGNLLFDFGDDNGLSGYLGAGVGLARVKISADFADSFDEDFDGDMGSSGSDSAAAWQLIAGIRTAVSENIDVGVKYRFFNTRKLEFGDSGDDDSLSGHWRSHSLLASLIYNFYSPPPPPAPAPPPPPPPPPPATQTCPDGSVILATETCPVPPPPPPPPPPAPERG